MALARTPKPTAISAAIATQLASLENCVSTANVKPVVLPVSRFATELVLTFGRIATTVELVVPNALAAPFVPTVLVSVRVVKNSAAAFA